MASCGYSQLFQNNTPCGASWRNPNNIQCISLGECNRDISQHLRSHKLTADDCVINEQSLLLARALNEVDLLLSNFFGNAYLLFQQIILITTSRGFLFGCCTSIPNNLPTTPRYLRDLLEMRESEMFDAE